MSDAKQSTRQVGQQGEELALQYLLSLGYVVRERNWHYGSLGELDLIAEDGATLVFVEVRTRRGKAAGLAEESVGASKQAKLAMLAEAYLSEHPLDAERDWRIDVLAVQLTGSQPRYTLYRNAVEGL